MKKFVLTVAGVLAAALMLGACSNNYNPVQNVPEVMSEAAQTVKNEAEKVFSSGEKNAKEAEKDVSSEAKKLEGEASSEAKKIENDVTSEAKKVESDIKNTDNKEDAKEAAANLKLTKEELAAYNGKDGMPAYVAVDDVIYDVTDVKGWENGEHKNGIMAGKDLTDEIKTQSPHGTSVLDDVPVVGKLV